MKRLIIRRNNMPEHFKVVIATHRNGYRFTGYLMTNGWWELHPFGEETFYAFEDIVSWEEI
jgi:hypothetical protein